MSSKTLLSGCEISSEKVASYKLTSHGYFIFSDINFLMKKFIKIKKEKINRNEETF